MKKSVVVFALLLATFILAALAAPSLKGADIVFCRKIMDREPVDAAKQFSADIGWVYCHTKIANAGQATQIHHDWYFKDAFISRQTLPVGSSPSWRTFSAKQMSPAWLGKWEVVVKTDSGRELARASFDLVVD